MVLHGINGDMLDPFSLSLVATLTVVAVWWASQSIAQSDEY